MTNSPECALYLDCLWLRDFRLASSSGNSLCLHAPYLAFASHPQLRVGKRSMVELAHRPRFPKLKEARPRRTLVRAAIALADH
jgi:hypothetical protein